MSTSQPPKPKRRWCRFSLKTLLVVMTVATVAFGGWVQYMRHEAQQNRERAAAFREVDAAIEELGGIWYGDITFPCQSWLDELFDDPGDGWVVRRVDLSNTHVTDVGLWPIQRLESLEWLDLRGTNVTDKGVKKLQLVLPNCEILH